MNRELLSQRKRILAKVMAVDDLEVLRLVEAQLDRRSGAVADADRVDRLLREVHKVLTGAGRN